jgi:hypothetical protein
MESTTARVVIETEPRLKLIEQCHTIHNYKIVTETSGLI